tara:strand:- start:69 stop:578 length:510 start_codon:yes stop_codon:yes gene_type:complete
LNIFLRQGFTETSSEIGSIVSDCFKLVRTSTDKLTKEKGIDFNFLTSTKAETSESFKKSFTESTGLEFTAKNFRDYRLKQIDETDLMIIFRTSLSESSAFELAYNIFSERRAPVFFAIHESAPIKTTLIRELESELDINYIQFSKPEELSIPIHKFLLTHSMKSTLSYS